MRCLMQVSNTNYYLIVYIYEILKTIFNLSAALYNFLLWITNRGKSIR